MPRTKQTGSALDTASAANDTAPTTTAGGDPTPAGMAAVSRIAAPAVDTTPSFLLALEQQMGAFATTLGISDASIFQPIVSQIVNDVAAKDSATSSSSTADGPPATGTTAKAPDPKAAPPTLTQDLQNEILSHVHAVEGLLPKDVQDKITAYTNGHPAALYAELLAAAVSDYFSGVKPQALSHKFDLGKGFSVTPKVQTGTVHEKFIQSIGATLDWKGGSAGQYSAEVGATHDFTADTTAYNLKLEDSDLEILKQKIDASFAYTHTNYPGGKSPGDKFVESFKLAHDDWTLQYQNSLSLTASKPVKGVYGARTVTDTNTLDVTKANAVGDVTLQGEGNFNIGGTAANNVGLKASAPLGSSGYTFSVEDIQSVGGGTSGAGNGFGVALTKGKLTLSIMDMPTGMKGMTGDPSPAFSEPIGNPKGRAVTFGVSIKF